MRIPLPSNVRWEDRDRVALPIAALWHGNAVEIADDVTAEQIDAVKAALLAFDPKAPTAAQQARERMERDKGKNQQADDIHARLCEIEKRLGLA